MKKILTLSLFLTGLSISTMSLIPAKSLPVTPKSAAAAAAAPKAKAAFVDWPRGIDFQIGYFNGLPMVTLTWPAFTQPGFGPVSVTFMGATQMVNPTTTTSIFWAGTSYYLTTGVTYSMNISGVTYYFQLSSTSGGWCTITGHT